MLNRCTFLFLALLSMQSWAAPLTEIVVTAELLESSPLEIPNSVSVVDAQAIEQRSARHLEDLLNMAPNVNFASGASRGRFVQIRGIGERSEFQEPIINSVGILVDGIDLTGIATAASTLDLKQVEVLRGPQGTLHGANALAGLINMVSNAPTDQFESSLNMALEEFGGRQLGGVLSGPINDQTAYRIAVNHFASDGFVDNVFLNRADTNNIDETAARLRLSHQANEDLSLDLTVLAADVKNGYDAFSLDNNRQTYSDRPGVDEQRTMAAALSMRYGLSEAMELQASLSHADSELQYSYDEDWSHPGICDNTACDSSLWGFDWFYASTDDYRRDNANTSLDLRLLNQGAVHSWVVGLYHRDQGIDLTRIYTFAEADFSSQLDTVNTALYGQYDLDLNEQWSLSGGLRFEQRDVDYADSAAARANPDEDLWGGRVALQYQADNGGFYYALISRGYKAGGFNLDGSIAADQRQFDSETMINYELGFKTSLLDQRLSLQTTLFYQARDDIQSKQSIVASIETGEIGGACPCSFTDFTDNAASGHNAGLEVEFDWQASERVNLFGSLGLLETEFDDFLSFDHVSADRDNGVPFNLRGREQAHAPAWQFMLGGTLRFAERWQLSGSVEGKDDFYFSDRHEERADSYTMLNLELAYQAERWRAALYAKNLSDELVQTRGFGSFGNDPRKFYETEPYNQFAAPRVIGVKANLEF